MHSYSFIEFIFLDLFFAVDISQYHLSIKLAFLASKNTNSYFDLGGMFIFGD